MAIIVICLSFFYDISDITLHCSTKSVLEISELLFTVQGPSLADVLL